jgi:hypothetical protein
MAAAGSELPPLSGQLHRPVIVAMIAVRMMQAPVHEVIDVVAMWNGFVPATRAMRVRAAGLGSAAHGIVGADGDGMLVDVVPMHVVEMPVVQIVDMIVVADRRMPAAGAVLVAMIGVVLFVAGGHQPSFRCRYPIQSCSVISVPQHAPLRYSQA